MSSNPGTREYIASVRAWLQTHYPHLLVVDNDGWRHVSVEGRLQSDLLTAHTYSQDPAEWAADLD